ncbi:hypothetical protein QUF70_20235, partial [Desulfobacterales bacterium HSG17]|nr:hypothetical protein [Desulfobacterales bacterium HSG17]
HVLRAEKIVLLATKTNTYYSRYCKMAYTEAFKRLGYTFDVMNCPSKRCGIMANTGQADGVMTRVFDYNKTFPNLVRVNYMFFQHRILAYAADPSVKLNGWPSLADTDFQVAFLHGSVRLTNRLAKLVNTDNLQPVTSSRQGLFMLIHGRNDLLISIEALSLPEMVQSDKDRFFLRSVKYDKAEKKSSDVYPSPIYVAGILETVDSYPFLHKKHKKLAPKMAGMLQKMEQEGLLEKYKASVGLQSNIKSK